jgi:hypothetical protein
MLSVVMLNVVTLSVIILSVVTALALLTNVRLGRKCPRATNALAYYGRE